MKIIRLGQVRGDWLALGKVVRPHGIKGELKLSPYSGRPEDFRGYHRLVLIGSAGQPDREFDVLHSQAMADLVMLRLTGLSDRTEAEALRGRELGIALADLPPGGAGVCYWHEIEGMAAVDGDGRMLGAITALMPTPGHDILVINGGHGELLIPAVDEMLIGMSPDGKALIVNPSPGLLEINQ